ncbi:MAG: type II toxin-antitoxin system VapC family toxin [Thermoproteota archaeon]
MSLFDSSAIINLCGEKRISKLLEGWTLNLAFYELGNAVWRQVYIHKAITPEEANTLLDALTEVFMNLKKPEKENSLEILKIAAREGLTYYDAAYIQAAIENKLTLVTDYEQLLRVGEKFVETIKSSELSQQQL